MRLTFGHPLLSFSNNLRFFFFTNNCLVKARHGFFERVQEWRQVVNLASFLRIIIWIVLVAGSNAALIG